MMRHILAASTALAAIAAPLSAHASSHREAPGITLTPKIDGTDFYMFRSYEKGRSGYVTLIADYQPFQGQAGGPNFFEMDPYAVYDINISNNGGAVPNLIFRFRFTNTDKNISLNVGGKTVPVAEVDVGPVGTNGNPTDTANLNVTETYTLSIIQDGVAKPVTNAKTGSAVFTKPLDYVGKQTLNDYTAYANNFIYTVNIPGCSTPGKLFAGQRSEPFFVDLSETFDLLNYKNPIGEKYANAGINDIAQYNISSLEIEVPVSCLMGPSKEPVIGGWTTASTVQTAKDGSTTLIQKSRLGMPLVNEVVIGLKDKDTFNGSLPANDAQFLTYVTNPTFPAIVQAIFGAAGVAAPTNFPRNDLVATFLTGIAGLNQPGNVTPSEMLRLNTGTAPTARGSQSRLGVIGGDNAGFPNGRRPGDDVVDVTVRVAMGRLCTLGLNGYCTSAQAPSGGLDFVDGAERTSNDYLTSFPYLDPPRTDSPNRAPMCPK
jgi:hypothetical protein